MKSLFKILVVLMLLTPFWGAAQSVINVYARVTAVSGTALTISNSTGSFTAGAAIVMQMQDSTLGTNTGNNNSFGNLATIQSAGVYEIVTVSAATATTITLSGSLS